MTKSKSISLKKVLRFTILRKDKLYDGKKEQTSERNLE